jgi:hypothetical protein
MIRKFWPEKSSRNGRGQMRSPKLIGIVLLLTLVCVSGSAGESPDQNGKQVQIDSHAYLQRNQTFDPEARDGKGLTNIQRMEAGRAPLGKDGAPVELHHEGQKNEGARIEVMRSEHQQIKNPQRESEIDRKEFQAERQRYWKERAKDFKPNSLSPRVLFHIPDAQLVSRSLS